MGNDYQHLLCMCMPCAFRCPTIIFMDQSPKEQEKSQDNKRTRGVWGSFPLYEFISVKLIQLCLIGVTSAFFMFHSKISFTDYLTN